MEDQVGLAERPFAEGCRRLLHRLDLLFVRVDHDREDEVEEEQGPDEQKGAYAAPTSSTDADGRAGSGRGAGGERAGSGRGASAARAPKKRMAERDDVYAGIMTSGKLQVVKRMVSCHAVSPKLGSF